MTIQNYLDAVGKRLGHLPAHERRDVLSEIEAHLHAETTRLMELDPGLTRPQAIHQATEAFGAADEIAVAYNAEETILRDAAGDVLLRIARRTGKIAAGTGRVAAKGTWTAFKILGIIILVAVAVATILAVGALFFAGTVLTAYQDDIVEAVPRPVYLYNEEFTATVGTTDTWDDIFQIGPNTKEFRVWSNVAPDGGCAHIQLVSPSDEVYDMTNSNCSEVSKGTTLSEQGTWHVRYTLTAYKGSIDIEVYSFERS